MPLTRSVAVLGSRRRSLLSSRSGPLALAVGLLTPACFTSDDGLTPPARSFYYPTALVTSPGQTTLYVVNSDFDLQYNGGTVQALNLTTLRGDLGRLLLGLNDVELSVGGVCAGVTTGVNASPVLHPGPCAPLSAARYIERHATIGAFASAATLVTNPEGGARLFVTVRGDPSVTYFDVTDDRGGSVNPGAACGSDAFCLSCAAEGSEQRCGQSHRVGEVASYSPRNIKLPVEPLGIAASADGRSLVVAQQTTNQASLLSNEWGQRPALEYYLSNLPTAPTDVLAIPPPAYATKRLEQTCASGEVPCFEYRPGFLITYRSAPQIDLLRVHYDEEAATPRPFLSRVYAQGIGVNASGHDSRGGAIDDSERRRCEAACGQDLDCLRGCLEIPLGLYIANRAPPSMLVGEIRTRLSESPAPDVTETGAFETLAIRDTVALSSGASRVAVGHVLDPNDGQPKLRVFAVAFDSRFIYSYDPDNRRIESVIRTGRGPHAISFDMVPGDHAYMYVGHFIDSYVGVVDLDARNGRTFGQMFATVGQPVPPKEAN